MHKNRSPCLTVLLESAPTLTDPVLRETRQPERGNLILSEATKDGQKVTRFKCVVAKVDVTNRNGRYYPRSAYEAAIQAAQSDLGAGKLWGLMEHAEFWSDPMKGRLEKIAGLFDKLAIEEDLVVGEGTIVETDSGKDLLALLKAGVAVGISTSGTASQKWLPAKEIDPNYYDPEGLIAVIQDDLRFLTIDFVSDPANPAGQATTERNQHPPIPHPKEGSMHPKIKALLEKYNLKTTEELKAHEAAKAEYFTTLEAIATESVNRPTPTPAPVVSAPADVSPENYRALEETVVSLRNQVESLNTLTHNQARDAIALTALESARLPSSGTVKHGDVEIDLDASFRSELIAAARTAESEDAAKTAVDRKIIERKANLRLSTTESRPKSTGVNLPLGDNSRVTDKPTVLSKTFENTRRSAGLL